MGIEWVFNWREDVWFIFWVYRKLWFRKSIYDFLRELLFNKIFIIIMNNGLLKNVNRKGFNIYFIVMRILVNGVWC